MQLWKIREARKQKGMTQEQLADVIGVKRAVISKYENGSITPSILRLEKIARALGVDSHEFFRDSINSLLEEADRQVDEIGHQVYNNTLITDAVAPLIELGANSECLFKLIDSFLGLNSVGQKKAAEQVSDLAKIPDYQNPKSPK